MKMTRSIQSTALLFTIAATATGCRGLLGTDTNQQAGFGPDDFVAQPRNDPANTTDPVRVASANNDAIGVRRSADTPRDQAGNASSPAVDQGQSVSVNAMVGHINGEAVYADQIFDINLAAQLTSFGRRFDGDQFRRMAYPVIDERLRGIILDKLILGEAEVNLKEEQKLGIDRAVNLEFEELLRFYGQGSLSKTRAEFKKDRGVALDDHLVAYRENLITSFYMRSVIFPRISVSQTNIENYYENNKNKYNKPDRRVFRVIRVGDAQTADAVSNRLKRGEPFKRIAADEAVNTYNPQGAGIFNDGEPLAGDKIFRIDSVNDALLALQADQHAGPFPAGEHHYFVQLIRFEPGVEVPLSEVQVQIAETLRLLEFDRQVRRVRQDLFEKGSFSDPIKMSRKLLEIADARFNP